jgi:hypothetical protein
MKDLYGEIEDLCTSFNIPILQKTNGSEVDTLAVSYMGLDYLNSVGRDAIPNKVNFQ